MVLTCETRFICKTQATEAIWILLNFTLSQYCNLCFPEKGKQMCVSDSASELSSLCLCCPNTIRSDLLEMKPRFWHHGFISLLGSHNVAICLLLDVALTVCPFGIICFG